MKQTAQYKQTSIGLIPSDWEVKLFDEVFDFVNTPSFSRDNLTHEKTENIVKYIHYGDIHSTFKSELLDVETEKIPFLKDEFVNTDKLNFLREGDLVIADASEDYEGIGECVELKNVGNSKIVGGLHTIVARSKNNLTVNGFKTYVFHSHAVSKTLKTYATGISVYGISKSNLSKLKLPLPSILEQQKIAEILSTWDNAIDICKKIIKKLKKRNKGLAQQLLTGKTRVKGFEGVKWDYVAINKIAKEISLKNTSDKDLEVLSCTKHHGLVPSLEYFGRKIYSDNTSTYKIVKKGQFAYATNHIEEGSIGYQSIFGEALISPMYTVFETNHSINDELFFKILKSYEYIHEYQRRMEGSIDRRGGLRWSEFSKIKIPVIDKQEQQAILDILHSADSERKQYEQKLINLQLQKKGLMQQLLTGKVRTI